MQVDCVIDENSDYRRRSTLKRKLDSLEDDQELLYTAGGDPTR